MSHAERLATEYIAFVEFPRFCVEFVFFPPNARDDIHATAKLHRVHLVLRAAIHYLHTLRQARFLPGVGN